MTTVPANIRVPFMYLAFDSSKALQGPKLIKYKALLMAQKISTGTKAELEVFRIRSGDEGSLYGGPGSQAHRVADQWFKNNKTTEAYMILIDDEGASAAAVGDITITGVASKDGTLSLLLNGVSVPVGVLNLDTATVVGDAVEDAINAKVILPFTAVNTAGVVALTMKNKGVVGNYCDIQDSFFDGETKPAGISVAHTPPVSGTGVIDIDEIIAVLGEEWYNMWVCPWSDDANVLKLYDELHDRFGPLRQIDGMAGISVRGAPSVLSTYATGKNYEHITCIHSEKIPQSPEEVASVYMAQVALEGEKHPSRPFQTVVMRGVLAPKVIDRFDWPDNNSLLYDGISTWYADEGGNVRIQRAITMYQVNEFAVDDVSYLNVNTLLTLMYMRFDTRSTFLTKYPRALLSDDGQKTPPGISILSPKTAKSEMVNIYKGWVEVLAIAENIDLFKTDLQVFRSGTDPDRLEFVMSPDLINQLRVLSGIIQFLLQAPSTT